MSTRGYADCGRRMAHMPLVYHHRYTRPLQRTGSINQLVGQLMFDNFPYLVILVGRLVTALLLNIPRGVPCRSFPDIENLQGLEDEIVRARCSWVHTMCRTQGDYVTL